VADALGELVIDMMSPTLSGVIALLWPACAGRILPRKACLYNRSKKWRMGCPLARRIAKLAGTTLMQGIKIADAIIAQDDRFTVDRKLAGAFLQGGLSDPRRRFERHNSNALKHAPKVGVKRRIASPTDSPS